MQLLALACHFSQRKLRCGGIAEYQKFVVRNWKKILSRLGFVEPSSDNSMRYILVSLCCLISLCALFISAFVTTQRRGEIYEELLIQQIELYKNGQRESIDLSEVNDVPWDKVYFFAPYTPVSEVNSVVAGVWVGAWLTDIQYSDRGTLFVFLKNGVVVQHLLFALNIADFSTSVRESGYLPEGAQFILLPGEYVETMWLHE